jgi:flagellar hook-associated protein 2
MSTISISGAGSGLDVASIVSSLMSAEKQALVPLTKEASSFNSLLSAYGSLKSSFSTFQTALNNLNDTNFSAQKTTLTNSGTGTTTEPFTASVDSSKAGKAVSQKLQSEVIANGTTFASGDSIAIQVGTEAPKFITLSEDQNLEQLVKTINDAKTDVNAAIFKDDDGKQHLVLESNLTGSSNTIKVFANGSLSTFGYNTSNTSPTTMTETRTAKDTAAAAPGVHDISISQLAQAQKLKQKVLMPIQNLIVAF